MIPQSILNGIEHEISRSIEKHGPFPEDLLLQVAIVGEEMGEVNKAIVDHTLAGKPLDYVYEEMEQVAAMAIKFLMSQRKA